MILLPFITFADCEEVETGPPAKVFGSVWEPGNALVLCSVRNWVPQSYNCKALNSTKNPCLIEQKTYCPLQLPEKATNYYVLKF